MSKIFSQRRLSLYMVVGLVLGILCGTFSPEIGMNLLPIGTAFLQAVKMLIVPLILCSITVGVYHICATMKNSRSLIATSFSCFLFSTLLAACIGVGVGALLHPGSGFEILQSDGAPKNFSHTIDWTKYFLDLIPSNIFAAMSSGNLLPVIFFSSLLAVALSAIGEQGKLIIGLLEAFLAAVFKLTTWIIALSPIAIFAIISWLIATQGVSTLLGLSRLIGATYIGLGILLIVFFIVLKLSGDNLTSTIRAVWPPVLLGFTTRSSEITLPLHMEKLGTIGVPKHVASTVLPLGYAFNRSGATLYAALAVSFLAEAYGLVFDWPTLLSIVVLSIVSIYGAANVPSGALVAIAVVATGIGLPVEAIAIIAGIDAFVDMGRTAVNVFGNTVAAKLVVKMTGADVTDATGTVIPCAMTNRAESEF